MKKLSVIMLIAFIAIAGTSFGQKAEVLFFKAELSCCKARACEQIEKDIKSIVEESFTDDEVSFREIKLANEDNKALIDKYNAKSQTVVVVAEKKRREKSIDISDLVARYQKTQDKEAVKNEIVDKIKTVL